MPAPRTFPLAQIAARLGGEVLGNPDTVVSGIATLVSAGPSDISFLVHGRYRAQLQATRAAAVIVAHAERDSSLLPRIVCDDPYAYYARVIDLFHPMQRPESGTHPSAVVDPRASVSASASIGAACYVARGAVIGERVALGPGCVIGEDSTVGDDSRLYASVAVYHGCVIGQRAIVHSGAVIGADGFGMARDGDRWRKIPQVGRVVIGNDVEIGANTTIDRGTLDDTVIDEGVKLDNQIQVGHNVHIGAHSALAGCVGIAGSTQIGRGCTVGGGAVILGHLELADGVHISAATVVTKSIRNAGHYAGLYPMQDKAEWARNAALLRNLEKLAERVRVLERRLAQLDREE